jgi:hypothetical protein
MRSTVRRTAVGILLIVILAPGLLQAGTPWDRVSVSGSEVFLNKVWSLLAVWWQSGDSGAVSKNGSGLDPAGQPPPGGTSGESSQSADNGCGLDPAGSCEP